MKEADTSIWNKCEEAKNTVQKYLTLILGSINLISFDIDQINKVTEILLRKAVPQNNRIQILKF